MLPARMRLRRDQDIKQVLRKGVRISTPHINIYAILQPQNEFSRLATIVSKKVNKSSVKRHSYQRWMRESAGEIILGLKNSLDMVWVALPSINKINSQQELSKSISPYLKDLNIEK